MIKIGPLEIGARTPKVKEPEEHKHILIIKHGALGDLILATGAMHAIKDWHPNATITLMTSPAYESLANDMPFIDHVITDRRPKPFEKAFWQLITQLRESPYERVYDLQLTSRSSWYFRLWGLNKPEWVGRIDWATHPYTRRDYKHIHTVERLRELLTLVGIEALPKPNVDWMKGKKAKDFGIKKPYALLIPGCSPQHTHKRWTTSGYQHVAKWFIKRGITPVILGTKSEKTLIDAIHYNIPEMVNLMDQTSFGDMTTLAKDALLALGSDTGPMHLVGASGCECVVLFSKAGDPKLHAPWGEHVHTLQEPDLKNLAPQDVIRFIETSVDL